MDPRQSLASSMVESVMGARESDPYSGNFEEIYLSTAYDDYKKKDYENCIKNLKWALFHNPNYYEAHFLNGSAFEKIGKREDAKKNYEQCIKIKPTKMDAYLKLVQIYESEGNKKKVEETKKTLQQLGGNSRPFLKFSVNEKMKAREWAEVAKFLGLLADNYLSTGDKIKYLENTIKKAEALYLCYDLNGALEILNPLLAQGESEIPRELMKKIYVILIKVKIELYEIDEPNGATDLIGIARNLSYDDFESLSIYCQLVKEKYDIVIQMANSFIQQRQNLMGKEELPPHINRVVFCLACAYLEQDNIKEYEKNISRFNPKLQHGPYFQAVAKYYYKKKDLKKCKETLEQLDKIYPNYIPGVYFKINLLNSENKMLEADKLMGKFSSELTTFRNNFLKFSEKNQSLKARSIFLEKDDVQMSMNFSISASMSMSKTTKTKSSGSEYSAPVDQFESQGEKTSLGEGGQGRVFKELIGGKWRACKYLKEDESASDALREEIQSMLYLRHENIVHLDGFIDNKIIMFLAEGGSLKSLIKNHTQPLSLKFKMMMIKGIADGLEYLHSKKVIHGDMKADNVLLSVPFTGKEPFPVPMICDFGMAVEQIDKSKTGDEDWAKGGTAAFMPPETFIDGKTSFASDVYTFGLTIYEIIFMQTPYNGKKQAEILELKKNNILPEMSDKDINKEIIDLIKFCCIKDPAQRPLMNDVKEEIKNIMQLLGFDK
ncbi:MAG: protein kinase [archaeon]|nr:protein kinase [archaeon]